MSKKTCKLCNRKFSHSYKMFGRGCFNTECNLLKISIPKDEEEKEKYFVNEISRRLNRYGISQNKKYELAEKYLTLEYLKKIKYGDLSKEKSQLEKDINNISFKNSVKQTVDKLLDNEISNTLDFMTPTITLNKAYRLYKTTLKFSQKMNELKKDLDKAKSDDEKASVLNDYIINDLSFIFDISKITIPVFYQVFFAMQIVLWEFVITGGIIFDYSISARFLNNALVRVPNYVPEDQTINEDVDIDKIKKDNNFKEKIIELLDKYVGHKRNFEISVNTLKGKECEDLLLNFENDDLFFSLHGTTISIKGKKKDNGLCDLIININDTYDFTKIRLPNQYGNDVKHILGNTLNNVAVASSQYGVLKTFLITSEIVLKNYDIKVGEERKDNEKGK